MKLKFIKYYLKYKDKVYNYYLYRLNFNRQGRYDHSCHLHMASSTVDGLKELETIVRNENVSSSTKARLQERIRVFEERMAPRMEESRNGKMKDVEGSKDRPAPMNGPKKDIKPINGD